MVLDLLCCCAVSENLRSRRERVGGGFMNAWVRFLAVLAAVAVLAVGGWKLAGVVRKPPEVDVVALRRAPLERVLVATGRVRPDLVVDLSPLVAGRLVGGLPVEGARVLAEDVVFRIDDVEARQALASASAAVVGQREERAQAQREVARITELARGGLVAGADLESAQLRAARAGAQLVGLERRYDELAAGRANYQVRAPFAAVVLKRLVDEGSNVGPANAVLRLASVGTPTIEVEIDELFLDSVRLDAEVRLAPLGGGPVVAGRVVYIGDAVDRTTGATVVRVAPADVPAGWIAGRSIDATIVVDRRELALAIPREAVLAIDGDARVLLLDQDGVVVERAVEVLDWPAREVVVESGLLEGDRVLLDPTAVAVGTLARPRLVESR